MNTFSSLFLLISLIAFVGGLLALHNEEENLTYINKILDLLNNKDECQLPSYADVDELQSRFNELELAFGTSFLDRLTDDQKLVREKVLDQWDSFYKMLSSSAYIACAKKRSFLCKIEKYQKAKFGFSICTMIKDVPKQNGDRTYEKNPLVRFLKHCETQQVCDPPEEEVLIPEILHDQHPPEHKPVEIQKIEKVDSGKGTEVVSDHPKDTATPTLDDLLENKNNDSDGENPSDPKKDVKEAKEKTLTKRDFEYQPDRWDVCR